MDPRGIGSARALASKADVSVQAVLRLMHGDGEPTEDVVVSVAFALGVTPSTIRAMAGLPAGENEPFILPPEANRLDRRQRAAVVELVRLLADTAPATVSHLPGRNPAGDRRGLKVAAKRKRDPDDSGSR